MLTFFMELVLISIVLLISIAALIWINKESDKFVNFIVLTLIIACVYSLTYAYINKKQFINNFEPIPTAMDVYRGKTDLKITYECVNGETTVKDSVVVFKK